MNTEVLRLSMTPSQKQALRAMCSRLNTSLSRITRSVITYGFRQVESLDPAAAWVLFQPVGRLGRPKTETLHVHVLVESVQEIDRWYDGLQLRSTGPRVIATGLVLAYGLQLLESETDSFIEFLLEQELEYEREAGLRRGRLSRVWS